MTCIVAVVENDGVWIGGDSASTGGWITRTSILPKIFRVHDMRIGATGNWRLIQLLQYHLPDVLDDWQGEDFIHYLVTKFVPAVRELFKEHGFSSEDNNKQTYYGEFMIVHEGSIYIIQSNYQVCVSQENYEAIGSGQEFALGALHAMDNQPGLAGPAGPDGRARLEAALGAAAHFSMGVSGPFLIEYCGNGAE